MLRRGPLTFPSRAAEDFQIVLFRQTVPQRSRARGVEGRITDEKVVPPDLHRESHVQLFCTPTHTLENILQKDPQLSVSHYTVEMSDSLKCPI